MLFFRQILLPGCFLECEILRSPMILHRSLLFIVTIVNDSMDLKIFNSKKNCKNSLEIQFTFAPVFKNICVSQTTVSDNH